MLAGQLHGRLGWVEHGCSVAFCAGQQTLKVKIPGGNFGLIELAGVLPAFTQFALRHCFLLRPRLSQGGVARIHQEVMAGRANHFAIFAC
jgi:hypothetical protein